MNIESLSWWQWVAIGLIMGLALAAAARWRASDQPIGGEGFISQVEFERGLRLPPVMGRSHLANIVVHPGNGPVDLVTLRRLEPETLAYQDCKFAAPRPYAPLGTAGPSAEYRVADFLRAAAKARPELAVRYAWWDDPAVSFAIWTGGSVLVIGGVWPILLRLLIGAGFGRKRETYDLDRFQAGPDPVMGRQEITADDRRRLQELGEEMIRGLQGTADAGPAVASPPIPVRELAPQPTQPVPAAPGPDREYIGQYYPVTRNAPHAFTLIEMLVVLGIISTLIALLLPAITTAQRQAQTTQCASNLHQLGMAFQMYANSNKGWLPAWSGWHTYPSGQSDDSPGPAWTIELIPYIGTPDSAVYNCPAFRSRDRRRNYFMAAQWAARNGMHAMKLTDVAMTSRFVLGGDKTQRQLYPPPFGTSEHLMDDADPDDAGAGTPILAWPWDTGGFYMHRGGNNVLFDDSHVALFERYDASAMTFNPKSMENWSEVTTD
ncbi:MAG TPA: type II secretion system protein [Tepidisphaeraceae bacterium]|nr:type II secretion system protein [Tepidisphaeraceae bacterium]